MVPSSHTHTHPPPPPTPTLSDRYGEWGSLVVLDITAEVGPGHDRDDDDRRDPFADPDRGSHTGPVYDPP